MPPNLPTIKKYLSSKCIGYRDINPANPFNWDFVAIYQHIGADSRGLLWIWRTEAATTFDRKVGLHRFGFPEVITSSFTLICTKGATK